MDTKNEVYEVVKEGWVYEVAKEFMPVRYKGSTIVKVLINGKMRGYKIMLKQCWCDPKDFPILDSKKMKNPDFDYDSIEYWIYKTVSVNESNIDMEAYISGDFKEARDKIYIQLCPSHDDSESIPHTNFKHIFDIIYQVEIIVDGIRIRVDVDSNRMEQWGISLDELHAVAMENSIRDYPPIMRTMSDCDTREYNLLLGDLPDTMDETYVLENTDSFYGASVLAYPGVLERVSEILDENFYFYAKKAAYVVLSGAEVKYDGWLLSTYDKWDPLVYRDDYFSRYVYEYDRKTGEILFVY